MAVAKLQIALVSLVLLAQCAVRCQDELRVEWTVSGVAQYANASLLVPLGYTVIFDCQNNSFSNVIYQADLQQQDSCNTSVTNGSHMKVGECRGSPSEVRQEVTQNSGMLTGTVHYEPGRIYYFTSYSDGTLFGSITRESFGGECLDGLKMAIEVLNASDATQIPDNNNEVSTLGESVVIAATPTSTPGATPVSPSEGGVQVPPLTTVHIAIIGAAGGVVVVIIVILLVVVCCICVKKGRSNKVNIPEEMEIDVVVAIAVENGVSDKLLLSTQSKNHQEKLATQRMPSKQSKPPVVESNQGTKQSQIKKQPSQLPNNAGAQSRSTAQAVSNTPKGGTKSQESKVERGGTRAGLRKGGSTDPSAAPSKRDVSNKTASGRPTTQTQGLPPSGQRGPAPPTQSLPPLGERTKEDTDASKSSNQKKQSGRKAQRTAPGMKKASSVGNESNHPPVSKTVSDSSSPRRSSVTPRRPAPGIPMQRSQTVTGKPPSRDNMRKKNNPTATVLNTPSSR